MNFMEYIHIDKKQRNNKPDITEENAKQTIKE